MTGKQHQVVGIGFGVAATIVCFKYTKDITSLAAGLGSYISCWWPDIDHNNTKLGRKRKAVVDTTVSTVSKALTVGISGSAIAIVLTVLGIVNLSAYMPFLIFLLAGCGLVTIIYNIVTSNSTFKWATKHRGIMHTLIPPIILWSCQYIIPQSIWQFLFIGFTVGYASHLISDSITPDKTPLLFPITTAPIGITLLQKDKKSKNATKEEIKKIDEEYKKKCDKAARLLAIAAVLVALFIL